MEERRGDGGKGRRWRKGEMGEEGRGEGERGDVGGYIGEEGGRWGGGRYLGGLWREVEERGDGDDKRCGGSTAARFLSLHTDYLSPFRNTGGL